METVELTPQDLQPLTLYQFIIGLDTDFSAMPSTAFDQLDDTMAALLKQGHFPLTASELLLAIDAAGTLPEQASFLVSESGQIAPDQALGLVRDMRFAVVRSRASNADLLVSTGAIGDPLQVFLQVAAWDSGKELYNYYMRVSKTWVWAGNSYHSLSSPSRGNGCFDSHVNGSLVMKELKQPWQNWQSMNATVLLKPNDPLRENSLYTSLSGAELLEPIVRAGVTRWTTARLKHSVDVNHRISDPDHLLRHLCTTTTVNLTSTLVTSTAAVTAPQESLILPEGFWLNDKALLDDLDIPADFTPPAVSGELYATSLDRYDFTLKQENFSQKGDTFFAFMVPEAAFEDVEVVRQMVQADILTAHFVASILMIDFANPIFSPARARLIRYVPKPATLDPADGGLSGQLATAIIDAAAGLPTHSPEQQFYRNWNLADSSWRDIFATRITDYMAAVNTRIRTADGFDDYVRLAESRRREFRVRRLNEFSLSLPVTNIPSDAPLLEMVADGTIQPK